MAWQEVQAASDVLVSLSLPDKVAVEAEEGHHSPAMTVLEDSMSDVATTGWDRVFPDREWDEQMALQVEVGEWDFGDDEDVWDFGHAWVVNSPPLNAAELYFKDKEPEPEPSPPRPPGSSTDEDVGRPNPRTPPELLRGRTIAPRSQPVTPGVPPPMTPPNLTAQPTTPPGLLSRLSLRTPSPPPERSGRRRLY